MERGPIALIASSRTGTGWFFRNFQKPSSTDLQRRIVLFLALLVCGCTGHGSEPHRAELSSFVGVSEAELVRRLGQPDASSGNISQQFVVFNNIDARYVNPSAGYHYGHDYNYGSGRAPAIAEFNCRTTFVIENGRVRAYDLTGNGCR